jgi:hypothetical protein
MSLPGRDEAAPYYFTYIDRIASDDIVSVLTNQLQEVPAFLSQISEEKSLHRYAPEKWSIRQVLNHVNDTERTFAFRALWFGRGFSEPLASFDQNTAANGARADDYSWASHVTDLRDVRNATLSLPEPSGGSMVAQRRGQRKRRDGQSTSVHYRWSPLASHRNRARALPVMFGRYRH